MQDAYVEDGEMELDALPQEDVEQVITEMGRHPRMQRVQDALYKQLSTEYERLAAEAREKAELLRMTQKTREETGVTLYGLQQQLAKLHVQLENEYKQCQDLVRDREEEELATVKQQDANAEKRDILRDLEKQLQKNEAELRGLVDTIRQVEKYNAEVESEIAVTRRATYKAEEAVANLEKGKKGQDLFIDSLTQQLKTLQEDLKLLDEQVAKAREESKAADEIIRETATEMEAIDFEKKTLMQQWRSALIGLSRRDDALMAAKKVLREAEISSSDKDIELEAVKREIRAIQNAQEAVFSRKETLEAESKFVEEAIAKIRADRAVLEERFALLQKSLGTTEAQEGELEVARRALMVQIENLNNSIQTVARERNKMETSILEEKNLQLTASKAVKNLNKQSAQLLSQKHATGFEIANLDNEMSRINIDKLNTEAHTVQLRGTLQKVLDELKAKDRLIEKYQLEVRQRNDDIEKKMYRVDRLNRKYEKMMENVVDEESNGPLEATISNLRRELEEQGQQSAELQREWLRDQTELVACTAATEELRDANKELDAKITILSQKRLRMLASIGGQDEEARRLEARMRVLHQDMTRLNDLIGKNSTMQQAIKNDNFVLEREFVESLKELEQESSELEQRTRKAREEKSQISTEIVEAERQLLLWEKKIELEKETKAALDPESGQAEVKSMEREIHRMRIRQEGLQREQEKLLIELERAVYKRETICTRYRGVKEAENIASAKPIRRKIGGGVGGAKASEYTKAGLQRKLAQLSREIQKTSENAYRYESAVAQRAQKNDQISKTLEEKTLEYGALEEQANDLQAKMNSSLYEKQRKSSLLERKRKLLGQFQAFARGASADAAEGDVLNVERGLYDAENRLERVKGIVRGLQGRFVHLDGVLDRVVSLCEENYA
eukprot:scaffold1350_cov249-Pinguiococcus_pyrenoidosus.AAC.3